MGSSSASVMTIGNFDGFHVGHQSLMKHLQTQSELYHVPGYVVTFKPHPIEVLYPGRKFERLFDEEDQEEQLHHFPPLRLKIIQFSLEFSRQSPEAFLRDLRTWFNPVALVVGHDFMFGHKKAGDHDFLTDYCHRNKIQLTIMPAIKINDQIVSSSKIRDELKLGGVESANQMLGRAFYLQGEVVHGRKLGRTIGIPTANILLNSSFIPRHGVYFTRVHYQGEKQKQSRYAVTNLGTNPTVTDERTMKVESHLFDFNEDLYGSVIRVELLKFLRQEEKFESFEALKHQISQDVLIGKKLMSDFINQGRFF